MNDFADDQPNITAACTRTPFTLGLLLILHFITCCVSLIYVTDFYAGYHIVEFDQSRLFTAALIVTPFAIPLFFFVFSRFSFGFLLGFYFYTMILGYLWLIEFSKLPYDHTLPALSAFASALTFLIPALLIVSPVKQLLTFSVRALDHLLSFILILAVTIIAVGVFHNFRLISIPHIYEFRDQIEFPAWLRYAIGVTSSALLPFGFACFVARRNLWRAAGALLLLLLFYPITLTKLTLFAPFWLMFLALLSWLFEARMAVLLSLFLPTSAGIILAALAKLGILSLGQILQYFGAVNFRMLAIPSIVLDLYNDFFSTHELTYFCQIVILKPFVACPYIDPLSVLMAKTYQFGNLNASLFATEGIASVGLLLAPLTALACGLMISFANCLAFGLPSKFILLSGGVIPFVFLNVPFTTAMLTNGGAVLFLLWYVTPRAIFTTDSER